LRGEGKKKGNETGTPLSVKELEQSGRERKAVEDLISCSFDAQERGEKGKRKKVLANCLGVRTAKHRKKKKREVEFHRLPSLLHE